MELDGISFLIGPREQPYLLRFGCEVEEWNVPSWKGNGFYVSLRRHQGFC